MKTVDRSASLLQGARNVHLVGICGVGMAGLAFLLKERGLTVTGCDTTLGSLSEWLRQRGIPVREGHSKTHISSDVDWVIRTAAVPDCSPEIRQAIDEGVPVSVRGEVLPCLLQNQTSIAVAGTHGKTTTAFFIAQLLVNAGHRARWCIGGEGEPLGGPSGNRSGSGDDVIVVEADESDGTLVLYSADISVITNIEFDHMEHFADEELFKECFQTFLGRTKKVAVVWHDDARLTAMLTRLAVRTVSFGFSDGADVVGRDLQPGEDGGSCFELIRDGNSLGRMSIPIPGEHNALNALAACAAALEAGMTGDDLRAGLRNICLPRRRFEVVSEKDDVLVVSDYSHHPTEIRALVRTARSLGRNRLVAVFQPHRYTRTLALGPEFPSAFDGVDEIILLPVYAASENALNGGTTWDLYRHFRSSEGIKTDVPVKCVESLTAAWEYACRTTSPGDAILVIGAGDVVKLAEWATSDVRKKRDVLAEIVPLLSDKSSVRADEPMASKTTLGVGGTVRLWVDIGTESDMKQVLSHVRASGMSLTVLGGGSNILVSDVGLSGIAVRLTGTEFKGIDMRRDTIAVGAGVAMARLLAWCEDAGWTGLEFLDGVPCTVGGALCMNAGGLGREIVTVVSWIRCLNGDGCECILRNEDLNAGYREVRGLRGLTVLEAGLVLGRSDASTVRTKRLQARERRKWMQGLRSAGSVFKNPGGAMGKGNDNAGWLIEQAGLKGARVGGAAVSERHANVVVADRDASSSDIRSLIEWIRGTVLEQFGVCLESELRFLG